MPLAPTSPSRRRASGILRILKNTSSEFSRIKPAAASLHKNVGSKGEIGRATHDNQLLEPFTPAMPHNPDAWDPSSELSGERRASPVDVHGILPRELDSVLKAAHGDVSAMIGNEHDPLEIQAKAASLLNNMDRDLGVPSTQNSGIRSHAVSTSIMGDRQGQAPTPMSDLTSVMDGMMYDEVRSSMWQGQGAEAESSFSGLGDTTDSPGWEGMAASGTVSHHVRRGGQGHVDHMSSACSSGQSSTGVEFQRHAAASLAAQQDSNAASLMTADTGMRMGSPVSTPQLQDAPARERSERAAAEHHGRHAYRAILKKAAPGSNSSCASTSAAMQHQVGADGAASRSWSALLAKQGAEVKKKTGAEGLVKSKSMAVSLRGSLARGNGVSQLKKSASGGLQNVEGSQEPPVQVAVVSKMEVCERLKKVNAIFNKSHPGRGTRILTTSTATALANQPEQKVPGQMYLHLLAEKSLRVQGSQASPRAKALSPGTAQRPWEGGAGSADAQQTFPGAGRQARQIPGPVAAACQKQDSVDSFAFKLASEKLPQGRQQQQQEDCNSHAHHGVKLHGNTAPLPAEDTLAQDASAGYVIVRRTGNQQPAVRGSVQTKRTEGAVAESVVSLAALLQGVQGPKAIPAASADVRGEVRHVPTHAGGVGGRAVALKAVAAVHEQASPERVSKRVWPQAAHGRYGSPPKMQADVPQQRQQSFLKQLSEVAASAECVYRSSPPTMQRAMWQQQKVQPAAQPAGGTRGQALGPKKSNPGMKSSRSCHDPQANRTVPALRSASANPRPHHAVKKARSEDLHEDMPWQRKRRSRSSSRVLAPGAGDARGRSSSRGQPLGRALSGKMAKPLPQTLQRQLSGHSPAAPSPWVRHELLKGKGQVSQWRTHMVGTAAGKLAAATGAAAAAAAATHGATAAVTPVLLLFPQHDSGLKRSQSQGSSAAGASGSGRYCCACSPQSDLPVAGRSLLSETGNSRGSVTPDASSQAVPAQVSEGLPRMASPVHSSAMSPSPSPWDVAVSPLRDMPKLSSNWPAQSPQSQRPAQGSMAETPPGNPSLVNPVGRCLVASMTAAASGQVPSSLGINAALQSLSPGTSSVTSSTHAKWSVEACHDFAVTGTEYQPTTMVDTVPNKAVHPLQTSFSLQALTSPRLMGHAAPSQPLAKAGEHASTQQQSDTFSHVAALYQPAVATEDQAKSNPEAQSAAAPCVITVSAQQAPEPEGAASSRAAQAAHRSSSPVPMTAASSLLEFGGSAARAALMPPSSVSLAAPSSLHGAEGSACQSSALQQSMQPRARVITEQCMSDAMGLVTQADSLRQACADAGGASLAGLDAMQQQEQQDMHTTANSIGHWDACCQKARGNECTSHHSVDPDLQQPLCTAEQHLWEQGTVEGEQVLPNQAGEVEQPVIIHVPQVEVDQYQQLHQWQQQAQRTAEADTLVAVQTQSTGAALWGLHEELGLEVHGQMARQEPELHSQSQLLQQRRQSSWATTEDELVVSVPARAATRELDSPFQQQRPRATTEDFMMHNLSCVNRWLESVSEPELAEAETQAAEGKLQEEVGSQVAVAEDGRQQAEDSQQLVCDRPPQVAGQQVGDGNQQHLQMQQQPEWQLCRQAEQQEVTTEHLQGQHQSSKERLHHSSPSNLVSQRGQSFESAAAAARSNAAAHGTVANPTARVLASEVVAPAIPTLTASAEDSESHEQDLDRAMQALEAELGLLSHHEVHGELPSEPASSTAIRDELSLADMMQRGCHRRTQSSVCMREPADLDLPSDVGARAKGLTRPSSCRLRQGLVEEMPTWQLRGDAGSWLPVPREQSAGHRGSGNGTAAAVSSMATAPMAMPRTQRGFNEPLPSTRSSLERPKLPASSLSHRGDVSMGISPPGNNPLPQGYASLQLAKSAFRQHQLLAHQSSSSVLSESQPSGSPQSPSTMPANVQHGTWLMGTGGAEVVPGGGQVLPAAIPEDWGEECLQASVEEDSVCCEQPDCEAGQGAVARHLHAAAFSSVSSRRSACGNSLSGLADAANLEQQRGMSHQVLEQQRTFEQQVHHADRGGGEVQFKWQGRGVGSSSQLTDLLQSLGPTPEELLAALQRGFPVSSVQLLETSAGRVAAPPQPVTGLFKLLSCLRPQPRQQRVRFELQQQAAAAAPVDLSQQKAAAAVDLPQQHATQVEESMSTTAEDEQRHGSAGWNVALVTDGLPWRQLCVQGFSFDHGSWHPEKALLLRCRQLAAAPLMASAGVPAGQGGTVALVLTSAADFVTAVSGLNLALQEHQAGVACSQSLRHV